MMGAFYNERCEGSKQRPLLCFAVLSATTAAASAVEPATIKLYSRASIDPTPSAHHHRFQNSKVVVPDAQRRMAKKPRSQRRKKGKSLGDGDDGAAANNGGDLVNDNVGGATGAGAAAAAEFLSDEHTIADFSVASSRVSELFDDDFTGTFLAVLTGFRR